MYLSLCLYKLKYITYICVAVSCNELLVFEGFPALWTTTPTTIGVPHWVKKCRNYISILSLLLGYCSELLFFENVVSWKSGQQQQLDSKYNMKLSDAFTKQYNIIQLCDWADSSPSSATEDMTAMEFHFPFMWDEHTLAFTAKWIVFELSTSTEGLPFARFSALNPALPMIA